MLAGLSLKRVPAGQPGAGIAIRRLHYSSDPVRWSPDTIEKLRATYTSDARWRREMECEALALEGELLYPEFSRDRNLCEPFDVSDQERWTIWMALDPHPRTAHAMVWEAFNARNDRVICGEFWGEVGTRYGPVDGVRWKSKDCAQMIQFFESDSEIKPSPFIWARGKRLKIFRRYMDTYGKATYSDEGDGEDYFDTYRRLGIEMTAEAVKQNKPSEKINLNFDPALKGHDNLAKAYDSIGRALAVRKDAAGKTAPPAMMIFEDCYECIDEAENVRYNEGAAERASDERPVSYQKHVL
jgi:hypothetical protein